MVISETVLVLAGGTAVLSILFGVRVAMRAVAGSAAAPRSDGAQAADASGTPDVPGVIALPPLIFLGFLTAATCVVALGPATKPAQRSPRWWAMTMLRFCSSSVAAKACLPLASTTT